MKKLLTISSLALFMLVGTFVVTNINPAKAFADGDDKKTEESSKKEDNKEEAKDNKKNDNKSPYSYTAQKGDSYSKIARKAVQTYGINKEVKLSKAQIIAAETYLTIEAGSPVLNIGQSVVLKEDSVKNAVNKAKDLSEQAQSLWQKYVKGVNFNTDKVGQAS